MLKPVLTSMMKKRFPNMRIDYGSSETNMIATVHPVHPSWKPIIIRDDEREITIFFGEFTHDHYRDYLGDAPKDAKVRAIAEIVIEELAMVFEDQIEFWSGQGQNGMGPVGSYCGNEDPQKAIRPKLWSGKESL